MNRRDYFIGTNNHECQKINDEERNITVGLQPFFVKDKKKKKIDEWEKVYFGCRIPVKVFRQTEGQHKINRCADHSFN